jgi:hypothetical protein
MFSRFSKSLIWLLAGVLLISTSACLRAQGMAVSNGNLPTQSADTPVVEKSPTRPSNLTSTPIPLPTATNTLVPPQPPSLIMITASKGNVYIRRGPGLAYNPIGILEDGESASAIARDILSDWVQVSSPAHPDQMGWVSLMTSYVSVDGDIATLPAIQVDDWPVASYLRNCTHHQMLVQPGGIIIPSLLEYPENEVWVYPGSYTVYDLDHPDAPQVAKVELREGVEIDIRVDGNDEKRKCP